MNDATYSNPSPTFPTWLKVFSAIGVIWYAFGLMQFFVSYTMVTAGGAAAAAEGNITQAHAAAIDETPFFIWVAFALASAAGLIGSVLLFLGKPAAKITFGLSLLSAAAYYLWVYGLSGTGADRPSEEMIIGLVVVAVTSLFFALSRRFV